TELEQYFAEPIQEMAKAESLDKEALLAKIRRWYNGYRWSGQERLYNPFSILTLMKQRRFANYWWETGTPTFLIKTLREGFHYDLQEIEAGEVMFESFTL
ncbi:AAA family ATPase, partial [Arthrospira platensis SPKY1]|nr:AAA family ATPase [Arthrospira platensis SPKY1]